MTATDTAPLPGMPAPPPALELPPPPPAPAEPDQAPKRPTTRAGRKAEAAARAAQRAQTGKADKSPKATPKATPRRASLESRLAGSIATMGTGVAVAGAALGPAYTADGLLIVQQAPAIAAALDKVAKDNPAVAASLERMLTAGVWSGLVAAMLPVAIGVAGNHGLIPEGMLAMLGAEPPAGTDVPAAPASV